MVGCAAIQQSNVTHLLDILVVLWEIGQGALSVEFKKAERSSSGKETARNILSNFFYQIIRQTLDCAYVVHVLFCKVSVYIKKGVCPFICLHITTLFHSFQPNLAGW
jgi:hypothetical protein